MGDRKADPRTVFVRGVDSSVTDAQLQELFSDVGPVKKAFLVRKGGKDGAHRGFGFVQFAVAEDAARAATELHGAELAGRKLKVEGAVKRAPLEERKKRKQEGAAGPAQLGPAAAAAAGAEPEAQPPAAKKPRPARSAPAAPHNAAAAEGKHKWVRAVAVGGLTPEGVDAAVQMARAAGTVEEVVLPLPDQLAAQFKLQRDGCTGEAFVAVYKSVKDAVAAVAKLHGQVAGGDGQQQAQQKGKKGKKAAAAAADAGGAACRVWARQLSGEGLHQKRWRLVVRNLPFTATEEDLRAAFSPAGFVWELALPRSASGRGRGFAFVGFTCKVHAERGIRLVNGQAVAGRPVAVDWAVAKSQYGTLAAGAAGGEVGAAEPAEGQGSAAQRTGIDALSDLDSDDEEAAGGAGPRMGHEEEGEVDGAAQLAPDQERRMLASVIDGILSDDEEGGGDSGGELDSDEETGSEGEGSEEDEDEEDAGSSSGDEEGASEGLEHGADSDSEGEAAEELPAAGPADPFSRKQLQQKAAAAAQEGDAQQQPQRPPPEEGATVFIRGLPLDVSKEQVFVKMKAFGPVRSCRLVVDKDSGKLKGTAFVDFYKRASAQAAADACAKGRRKEGPGVVIAGRVADVDMALGQDDVRALAVAKAGEKGERSRRLALAKEGQIAEGSPAWEGMSAGDRAKRKRAAEEKKLKLRSPNFVVSETRLSVRNIPPSWTEKELKACFIKAVRERAKKAQPVVRQAKILLDEERAGPDGVPRSKGIGFVEFGEHEHALCALRQLNNNPDAFSKDKRPIVEFALENVKALKFREAKLAKAKQQQQTGQAGAADQSDGDGEGAKQQRQQRGASAQQPLPQQQQDGEGGDEPEAPKSKRQQRKEVKAMLREKRRQQQVEGGSAATANGTPEGAEKGKAAKRREQRKRKQLEGQGLATAAAAAPLPVAVAPSSSQAPAGKQPGKQQLGKQQSATQQPGKQQSATQQPGKQQPGKQQPGKQQPAKQQSKQQQSKQPQQAKPAANSRAARTAVSLHQEQQAQRRKRTADDLIDRLAEAGSQGGARVQQKKRKKEETDSVDALAKQYLSKYFDAGSGAKKGGSGGQHAAAAAASQRAALKRWFE